MFGQNLFHSGKRGCIRGKVDVFVQSGCIIAKLLHSGKN